MKLKILLTNDDGIGSVGLNTLYNEIKHLDNCDVYVVAPSHERSGVGHSVSIQKELYVKKINEYCYSLSGTPTDCVKFAYHCLFNKDLSLVISGINPTPNLGEDITYSGTVAAALEAAIIGVPALALSLAPKTQNPTKLHFGCTAKFAKALIGVLIKDMLPQGKGMFLNVNVPNLSFHEIEGVELTRYGKRIYEENVILKRKEGDSFVYWIESNAVIDMQNLEAGTDTYAIYKRNCISITPLRVDLTDNDSLRQLDTVKDKLHSLFKK